MQSEGSLETVEAFLNRHLSCCSADRSSSLQKRSGRCVRLKLAGSASDLRAQTEVTPYGDSAVLHVMAGRLDRWRFFEVDKGLELEDARRRARASALPTEGRSSRTERLGLLKPDLGHQR